MDLARVTKDRLNKIVDKFMAFMESVHLSWLYVAMLIYWMWSAFASYNDNEYGWALLGAAMCLYNVYIIADESNSTDDDEF